MLLYHITTKIFTLELCVNGSWNAERLTRTHYLWSNVGLVFPPLLSQYEERCCPQYIPGWHHPTTGLGRQMAAQVPPQMCFNLMWVNIKIKLVAADRKTDLPQYTMYTNDLLAVPLCLVETQRYAGVTFDEDMAFRQEINLRATKVNNIMGIMRRTNTYLDTESFKLLFKSLLRQLLENGAPMRNPRLKRDI